LKKLIDWNNRDVNVFLPGLPGQSRLRLTTKWLYVAGAGLAALLHPDSWELSMIAAWNMAWTKNLPKETGEGRNDKH
jgi:hypothetical protein